MMYLDYSATTPVNNEVLEAFTKFNQDYFANPNSTHELGLLTKLQIDKATLDIKKTLGIDAFEVIYTSGATESNNLALKGYALGNQHLGKHIISTPYEHSSVTTCLNYLEKCGFEVDILDINESGLIDLTELEKLIRSDTILVSIALINSEVGIKQNLEKITNILKKHPHVRFHSDMTQAIGKQKVDLSNVDLVSFTAHKIYGLKGIGVLLRRKNLNLTPVVHGGKSTSIFRGGTPPAPLIYSLAIALKLAYEDFDKKLKYIQTLYDYLCNDLLPQIECAHINYKYGVPQIVNVSFTEIYAGKLLKELSKRHIIISTQTACSSEASYSATVKRITFSDKLAKTSVRISISHLTQKKELDELIIAIKEILHENS
ncbi:cysteine desulfurase family protein [Mycoplasmatota bacterium WC30]